MGRTSKSARLVCARLAEVGQCRDRLGSLSYLPAANLDNETDPPRVSVHVGELVLLQSSQVLAGDGQHFIEIEVPLDLVIGVELFFQLFLIFLDRR